MSTPAAHLPSGHSTAPTTPTDKTPAINELRDFLVNAPSTINFEHDPSVTKFKMGNGEEISCVLYNRRLFITGTDVVKILIFRFQQLGRGILNPKKFEEGVFSDLRNLKPGTEAVLEEPRSEFLEYLHKHSCIRTQKKQKVFFWNKVPHDDLFREALERNLKRVTNVVSWAHLMNSPDVMKQYMMMQAAASGQMMMGMMQPGQMHPGQMQPGQIQPGQMMPQYAQYPQFSMMPMMPDGAYPTNPTPAPNISHGHGHGHPRRTISLSAVDFTPRQMPMMMPDISSALSSPLFSPDVEISENYFDVPDTPLESSKLAGDPMISHESSPMTPQGASPMTISLPTIENDFSTLPTMHDDPSAPSSDAKLDAEMMSELDALGATPELIGDPTLSGDLTSSELLNELWPDKTADTAPLWDDLSMLMPNIEPNLRGSE